MKQAASEARVSRRGDSRRGNRQSPCEPRWSSRGAPLRGEVRKQNVFTLIPFLQASVACIPIGS
jgi:hypothetical protein